MAIKSLSMHFSWYFNCSVLQFISVSSATGMKKPFIARMLLKQYKDENSSLLPGKLAEGLNVLMIKRCNPTFLSAFNEEINAKARTVDLQTRLSGWKEDWSNVFWWQHTSSGRKRLDYPVCPCFSLSLNMVLFDKHTSFSPWSQEDHGSHEFPSDSLTYDAYRCLRKQLLWPSSHALDLIVPEQII